MARTDNELVVRILDDLKMVVALMASEIHRWCRCKNIGDEYKWRDVQPEGSLGDVFEDTQSYNSGE